MSKGLVTFKFGGFPWRVIASIASLSLVTWFDIWSKLNWFGSLLMISAIALLIFQPAITVKTDKVTVEKEYKD